MVSCAIGHVGLCGFHLSGAALIRHIAFGCPLPIPVYSVKASCVCRNGTRMD
jgi:hypothetical protein